MTRVRIALATVVTVVWLFGYGYAYATHGQTPQELSGLMVLVLGWAFAGELKATIRRRLNDDRGGDDAPRD